MRKALGDNKPTKQSRHVTRHSRSEPARQASAGAIDQALLASLRQFQEPGEADFLTELIDLFLNDADLNLRAMHEAVANNDEDEIVRLAHRLKGSSANLGAARLAALFAELEGKDSFKDRNDVLLLADSEFQLVREALLAEREKSET